MAIQKHNRRRKIPMKLEHVALNVPNVEAVVNFFAEQMGMRVVMRSNTSPSMHFLADEAGSMLELYSNPAAPMPDYSTVDPLNLHLAFLSHDIEADRQRLIAAGAQPLSEIVDSPVGGARLAFFRGPDAVPFQLVQRDKPLI
jgi:glyoxylase I family protein